MIDEKILLELLDSVYLTEDDSSNDIFLRDDLLLAIDEVLNGEYKERRICLNCKKNDSCKYKSVCKTNKSPFSNKDYFTKKWQKKAS